MTLGSEASAVKLSLIKIMTMFQRKQFDTKSLNMDRQMDDKCNRFGHEKISTIDKRHQSCPKSFH